MSAHPVLTLDGSALDVHLLARVSRDPRTRVEIAPDAVERVAKGRAQIESIVERYSASYESGSDDLEHVYGVTTGFGEFKNAAIPPEHLEALQRNILLSHAVGVGPGTGEDDRTCYFPPEVVRCAMILRLNAFLQGHSGVRVELCVCIRDMVNARVIPLVPLKGSVGSSGDLCPLSHTFGVLLGEGRYAVAHEPGDMGPGWMNDTLHARELERTIGRPPTPPSYKEGLALTNGTTYSTALLALAARDACEILLLADIAAALSLEAMCGRRRALDPRVHALRPHAGQARAASMMRALLVGSTLADHADDLQDPYSLRCAPQVHGASRDALSYALMVLESELASVTDNPLFFPDDPGDGSDGRPDDGQGPAFSAGNFHGQPVGLAADFLAIGLAEIANISERRTQMILDKHHSRNLPAHLAPFAGVNSGFMIAQYTQASLVSENKILCHPASVDSIPTSANSEDHNAMSTIAARKLREVLANVQACLAIELMVAAQAVEWRVAVPSRADPNLRGTIGSAKPTIERGQRQIEEFAIAVADDKRSSIADRLGVGTRPAYLAIRGVSPPLTDDRMLADDIRRIRVLFESGRLVEDVARAVPIDPFRVRPLRSV